MEDQLCVVGDGFVAVVLVDLQYAASGVHALLDLLPSVLQRSIAMLSTPGPTADNAQWLINDADCSFPSENNTPQHSACEDGELQREFHTRV